MKEQLLSSDLSPRERLIDAKSEHTFSNGEGVGKVVGKVERYWEVVEAKKQPQVVFVKWKSMMTVS